MPTFGELTFASSASLRPWSECASLRPRSKDTGFYLFQFPPSARPNTLPARHMGHTHREQADQELKNFQLSYHPGMTSTVVSA